MGVVVNLSYFQVYELTLSCLRSIIFVYQGIRTLFSEELRGLESLFSVTRLGDLLGLFRVSGVG